MTKRIRQIAFGLPRPDAISGFSRCSDFILSQKTRYALKALLELGLVPPGATMSAAAISSRRNIPVKFLEGILVELKRDRVLNVHRGLAGGYRLARPTSEISFGAVVRLMELPLALLPCVSESPYRACDDCNDERACELKRFFREVRNSTASILDGSTLADALASVQPTATRPPGKTQNTFIAPVRARAGGYPKKAEPLNSKRSAKQPCA